MKLCRLQEIGYLSDTAEAKRRCGKMTAIVKDNRIHTNCPDCGWYESERKIADVKYQMKQDRERKQIKGAAGNNRRR